MVQHFSRNSRVKSSGWKEGMKENRSRTEGGGNERGRKVIARDGTQEEGRC